MIRLSQTYAIIIGCILVMCAIIIGCILVIKVSTNDSETLQIMRQNTMSNSKYKITLGIQLCQFIRNSPELRRVADSIQTRDSKYPKKSIMSLC